MSLFEWISLITTAVSVAVAIRKAYQAGGWRKALGVAIDEVESLEHRNPAAAASLKKAIRQAANATGVEETLHAEVKRRTTGSTPTAPPAAAILFLLAAGLGASGCSIFGAPSKEESLGARVALDRMDAALVLADTTWEANLREFAVELEAAAHAETDQAVLDDLRKLEQEGKLTQASVREVYDWSATTKARDAADIRGALSKALGTRSRAELKEVWAKVRTYWAARLDADALRADTEAQLRGLLEKSGIQLPGSVDRLFTPRELKPAPSPAPTPHE